MQDVHAETGRCQIIFHNDDDTPERFVAELLHLVFKKSVAEAIKFTETLDAKGKAVCGIYPRHIAQELIEDTRQRILAAGHSLLITSEAVAENGHCKVCGTLCSANRLSLNGMAMLICDDCMHEVTWPGISPAFLGIS
jgi:ATP-dependent Clp protease adaptor protein ClpS